MFNLLKKPSTLVLMAFFIALNVILSFITSGITVSFGGIAGIKIGLGGFPIILSGILMGPIAGGIVGIFSDVIGWIVNPMGPFMPHFTLTAALTGIIPAVVLRSISRSSFTPNFLHLIFAVGIGQVITSVLLVPYFLYSLFQLPLVATVTGNAISQAVSVPLYSYLILFVLKHEQIKSMAKQAVQ